MKKTLIPILIVCAGIALAQDDAPPMPGWVKKTKEHAGLKKLEGEWAVTSVFFMPDGAKQKSTGTASAKVILGGNFVQQTYAGTMMGNPFHGLLHIGFDTVNKRYRVTWMDDFSPYLYVYTGVEKDGAIHLEGKEPSPMTGAMQDSWMVITWNTDDQYTLDLYGPGPDGKKHHGGQFVYTRKKG